MKAPDGEYSSGLVITYFTFSAVASFMSILYLTVTIRNITECAKQIKTGKLNLLEFQTPISVNYRSKSSAIRSTVKDMRFKMQILDKIIKQETTNIFVGLLEDLPFFV